MMRFRPKAVWAILAMLLWPQIATTQTLERVIDLGDFFPFSISANDSIDRLYLPGVSFSGSQPLGVVDGNENTVRFVDIHQGELLTADGAVANRVTGDVYVWAGFPGVVRVVDGLKDEVASVPVPDLNFHGFGVGPLPRVIDVNSETSTLYLLDTLAGVVGALDPETQSVTQISLADGFPLSLAVNSTTNTVYVSGGGLNGTGLLWILNGEDLAVSSLSFGIEFSPLQAIAVNDATNTIYLGGAGESGRAIAIVDGTDLSFRVLQTGDFEAVDLAVNSRANQIVALGWGAFQGGTFLKTIDGATDHVETVELGSFDPAGVAVNRYDSRIYVAGASFSGEHQLLVFAPRVCASDVTSLDELVGEIESLTATSRVVQRLTWMLQGAQSALNANEPELARQTLALFQATLVALSNLKAVPLDEANNAICSASNVLVGVQLP